MNETQDYIERVMLDLQNEVDEYLLSDVPLENMRHDIDWKIEETKKELIKYFTSK